MKGLHRIVDRSPSHSNHPLCQQIALRVQERKWHIVLTVRAVAIARGGTNTAPVEGGERDVVVAAGTVARKGVDQTRNGCGRRRHLLDYGMAVPALDSVKLQLGAGTKPSLVQVPVRIGLGDDRHSLVRRNDGHAVLLAM